MNTIVMLAMHLLGHPASIANNVIGFNLYH